MSIHAVIIERANQNASLAGLIDGRIAQQGGLAGWVLPYIIFRLAGARPTFTMRAGPDLTTANVEANLYASSGATLDLMESAWHSAFHKQRWTTARLGSVKSWITSTYDDSIQSLETDTKSRAFLRVIETTIAFIPA